MGNFLRTKTKTAGEILNLDVGMIVPNRAQPRKIFSDEELASLADSVRENGIIQPITVRKNGALYEIISGERRFRAAKIAGFSQVPCVLREADDEQSAVLALIENIQRRDLNFFEEASALARLIDVYGLTQEQAAQRLGKAQSTVANKLRLLKFSDAERNLLITGNLSERQARALVRISDGRIRRKALETAVSRRLNIEQTEALVDKILSKSTEKPREKSKNLQYSAPPKLYINSLNALLKRIRDDNIPCEMSEEQRGDFYEYTIRFPISSV